MFWFLDLYSNQMTIMYLHLSLLSSFSLSHSLHVGTKIDDLYSNIYAHPGDDTTRQIGIEDQVRPSWLTYTITVFVENMPDVRGPPMPFITQRQLAGDGRCAWFRWRQCIAPYTKSNIKYVYRDNQDAVHDKDTLGILYAPKYLLSQHNPPFWEGFS